MKYIVDGGFTMIINTHLLFSKLIFKHCLKESDFKLSKSAFMYGNIKPDIFSEHANNSHSLEDSINAVQGYINKLLKNELTVHELSLTLGMLCHYTCDFFCIYHRKDFTKTNILKHLMYEIKLHFTLIYLLITKKLKPLENNTFHKKDILSIILEIQNKYLQEENSIIKDINYALSTAILISESVLNFSIIKTQSNEIKLTRTYEFVKN